MTIQPASVMLCDDVLTMCYNDVMMAYGVWTMTSNVALFHQRGAIGSVAFASRHFLAGAAN